MISLLFALSAGALALPQMNPSRQLQVLEYLTRRHADAVSVQLELTVNSDGRLHECEVRQYAGNERTAGLVCNAMELLRFEPATNSEGAPVYGKFYTLFETTDGPGQAGVPLPSSQGRGPSIELQVLSLPAGESLMDVPLVVLFGEMGNITECQPAANADAENALSVEYAEVACSQAAALFTVEPIFADDETAVPYVDNLTVRFVAEQTE